jgi:hypothetical protein
MPAVLVMDFLKGQEPHFNSHDLDPNFLTQTNESFPLPVQWQATALFTPDDRVFGSLLATERWEFPTTPPTLGEQPHNDTFPSSYLARHAQGQWQPANNQLLFGATFRPLAINERIATNYSLPPQSVIPTVATSSVDLALDRLRDFFSRDNYLQELQLAYGKDLTTDTVIGAILQGRGFANAKLQSLPKLEILSPDSLGTAAGAFDGLNNKIYLSSNLVNRGNVDEIASVIIEEIGHFLDRQFHGNLDAPGDEGAIFSRLVRDNLITAAEYRELIQEDDWGEIIKRQRHWRVATAIDSDIFTDRYLSRQLPIDRQIFTHTGV